MQTDEKRVKMEEKLNADDIVIESPELSKLGNFWYHYKWTIIISLFFVVVFSVCLVQCLSRESEDISIMYAGNKAITTDEITEIRETVAKLLPSDFDGNGKKQVNFACYEIYSEQEIKEVELRTDEFGNKLSVNLLYNKDQFKSFTTNAGMQFSLCFLDEFLYEEMRKADRIAPLTDIFGNQMPKGAMADGYGIKLGDTDFYKSYPSIQALPEDTILCIMKQTIIGNSKNDKLYKFTGDVMTAIATAQ